MTVGLQCVGPKGEGTWVMQVEVKPSNGGVNERCMCQGKNTLFKAV